MSNYGEGGADMQVAEGRQSNPLWKLCFLLLMVGVTFQDLPLQNLFGTIARSLMVFIAPAVFLIIVATSPTSAFGRLPKIYLAYSVAGIVAGLFMLVIGVAFFNNYDLHVYDEFIPVKLVKGSMYNFVYFFSIFSFSFLVQKLSLHYFYSITRFTFWVLVGYGILQLFIQYPLPFLHASNAEGLDRVVLFSTEPSNSTPFIVTMGVCVAVISFFKSGRYLPSIIVVAFTLFLTFASLSKAAFIFIIIAMIWTMRKRLTLGVVILGMIILVPIMFFFVNVVLPLIFGDIESFNSFSTRSTTWVAGMKSLFIYPLGEGYGTYLVFYPKMLMPIHHFIEGVLGLPLASAELEEMVAIGKNLPAKAGIPNEIIYNGIFAVVFFYVVFKFYFSRVKLIYSAFCRLGMYFLGIFLFLEFLFNVSFETSYYFLLPFVVMDVIIRYQRESDELLVS